MNAPQSLRNLHGRGELAVHWPDALQIVSHARLRGACPCSQCRATKLRGGIAVVREDVRVERIEVQGYGVQLVFSDGHERGIFPWAYLRDLG
ncbi:gamma-butyrobetaine hydroxylase-like domain-containing protein [Pseudomonas guariconensis]|uniref:gamma-butyrobetaine hydroxylase-like domain-containing protein n=1 Tax=Pseudomonas guariconensis TaxID=1288410 RepID=UPI0034D4F8B5